MFCLFYLSFFIVVKFTYHTIHHLSHFKVCGSVAFNTFTILCSHHQYPVPEYFHYPKRKPIPSKPLLPITLFPQPLVTTNLLSVSVHLSHLAISYRTIRDLLYQASFTLHIFKVHPCCSMYQDSFFYDRITFHKWTFSL